MTNKCSCCQGRGLPKGEDVAHSAHKEKEPKTTQPSPTQDGSASTLPNPDPVPIASSQTYTPPKPAPRGLTAEETVVYRTPFKPKEIRDHFINEAQDGVVFQVISHDSENIFEVEEAEVDNLDPIMVFKYWEKMGGREQATGLKS